MARLAFAVNADLARVVILPDALAVFIAGDEPPAAHGRRGLLAAADDEGVIKNARAAVEKRLVRIRGVLLPEHVPAAAAVVRNAPAPPAQLLPREGIPLARLALLRRPFDARFDWHCIIRVFKPGEEHRLKIVLPGHGGVPPVLEILAAVGGALDDDHRPRPARHGLQYARERRGLALAALRPEGVFRKMHTLERVAPPDAAPARRGAAKARPKPRQRAARCARRVFKHQLLRV